MITRKYYLIGNSKSGTTTLADDSGITSTFGTDATCDTGGVSIYSQPYVSVSSSERNFQRKCLIERTLDIIHLGEYEWFAQREEIAKIREGWLKPHKQIKPGNNSKINYNLPRKRIREKKQIFPKAA